MIRDTGGPALEEAFMDGNSVRAPHKAAGAEGGRVAQALGRPRGGYGTKTVVV